VLDAQDCNYRKPIPDSCRDAKDGIAPVNTILVAVMMTDLQP
jgi:hypothetical protein